MKPDQSVEIQLVDASGAPLRLGNILLEQHFFTNGNFRYSFKVLFSQRPPSTNKNTPKWECEQAGEPRILLCVQACMGFVVAGFCVLYGVIAIANAEAPVIAWKIPMTPAPTITDMMEANVLPFICPCAARVRRAIQPITIPKDPAPVIIRESTA